MKDNFVERRIFSFNTFNIAHYSLLTCTVSDKTFGIILTLATSKMISTPPPRFFQDYPFVIPSCSLYMTCPGVVYSGYLPCIVYSELPESAVCCLYFGKLTAIITLNISSVSSLFSFWYSNHAKITPFEIVPHFLDVLFYFFFFLHSL